MDRQTIINEIEQYIELYDQYKVIKILNVRKLLGDRTDKLLKDRIRRLGPKGSDAIYYWNVVDYLQFPEM